MKFISSVLVFFLLSFNAMASDISKEDAKEIKKLEKALSISMPNVKPSSITKSPVEGMYEVIVDTQVVYMSVDAKYMIQGDLYDLIAKKNITEGAKSTIRLAKINELGVDKMLVYSPEVVKDTITVVTDIDCPYCRRLHSEVPDYLKENVEVRYIFMPLKGEEDMRKTISVWCSDDQQLALDIAKTGSDIEEKKCNNPIDEHLRIARELGVRGTPAIILEDGQLLPGYVPVDKLVAELRK